MKVPMTFARRCAALGLVASVLLTGCESISLSSLSKRIDYKSAASAPTLEHAAALRANAKKQVAAQAQAARKIARQALAGKKQVKKKAARPAMPTKTRQAPRMKKKRFARREDLGLSKAEFAVIRRLNSPEKDQHYTAPIPRTNG